MASGEDDGDSQNARMRVAAGRRAVFPMLAALVAGAAVWSGVGHRIVGGWQPQGDDAEIAWLTHNVFTHRIPQVGMPSTVGGHGSPAHHWGPLLFWVLALPQRVASEHPVGLLVGLVILQLVALGAIAGFTARRVGSLGVLAMMLLVGLVGLSLGRDTMSSVWNPNIAVLPLAAVFVTAWSCAAGDRAACAFLVFFASFVVQANVLYTPVVGMLVVWAIVGSVVTARSRAKRDDGSNEPGRRSRAWWVSALLVGGVAWMGPIGFEIRHQPGNVSALLDNGTGEGGAHVGLARTVNLLVHGVGGVPVWLRRLGPGGSLGQLAEPGGVLAIATAVLLVLGLVAGWWWFRRDHGMRSLLGTAIFGLIGATIGISRLPWTFGVPVYRLWTLWILGVFLWFAAAVLLVRVGRARAVAGWWRPPRAATLAPVVIGAALVVVAVLGVVGRTPRLIRESNDSNLVRTLVDEAQRHLVAHRPYVAVQTVPAIGPGVLWGLKRHGVDIRITDSAPFEVDYVGRDQVRRDERPRHLFVLQANARAPIRSPGRRIASAVVQRNEVGAGSVRDAERRTCRVVTDERPTLSAKGRRRLRRDPRSAVTRHLAEFARTGDGCALVRSRAIVDLVDDGDLTFQRTAAAEVLKLRLATTAHQTLRYEIRVAD